MSKTERPPIHAPRSEAASTDRWRRQLRERALGSALQKRESGVPTYTVLEAAVLLSISQEYLYRLIQAGSFPAVRMQLGAKQGRYVVPARAVERLLDGAAEAGACVEATSLSESPSSATSRGAG